MKTTSFKFAPLRQLLIEAASRGFQNGVNHEPWEDDAYYRPEYDKPFENVDQLVEYVLRASWQVEDA